MILQRSRVRFWFSLKIEGGPPHPVVHLFLTAWYVGPGLALGWSSCHPLGQYGECLPSVATWEVYLVLLLAEKKFKNYLGQESSEVAMKLTVRPMPQDSSLLDF